MLIQIMFWVVFNIFVFGMLTLDLVVFHRKAHEVNLREAIMWSGVWIALALVFNLGVYIWFGSQKAVEFLTGYIIEKSLSVDNLFVFLLIFSYFQVPSIYQHKVLFWGILGALVMRGVFIFAGVTLIEKFHWVIYLFGAFLIATGIKMAVRKKEEIDVGKNRVLRLLRRFWRISDGFEGGRFIVKKSGSYFATPLLVTLVIVETTDVVFATDSVPAILAITRDIFIVYTSNVFAILGLRALYFALAGLMRRFHHLDYGLSVILVFVGVKMVLADIYKIPVGIALAVVAAVLLLSIIASNIWREDR